MYDGSIVWSPCTPTVSAWTLRAAWRAASAAIAGPVWCGRGDLPTQGMPLYSARSEGAGMNHQWRRIQERVAIVQKAHDERLYHCFQLTATWWWSVVGEAVSTLTCRWRRLDRSSSVCCRLSRRGRAQCQRRWLLTTSRTLAGCQHNQAETLSPAASYRTWIFAGFI